MNKAKIFLLIGCCVIFSAGKAQLSNVDPETKKVFYQETVTVDSLDQETLFERGSEWMAKNFKTNQFDVKDKANFKLAHEGEVYVTYTYDFKYKSENTITYTITLEFKEGKYRYTLEDFKMYKTDLGPRTAEPVETSYQKLKSGSKSEFAANFSTEVEKVIEDLKNFIKSANSENEDDW